MTDTSSDVEDFYDTDSESANVIVDIAVLEAAKENIQPLAKGRRVTSLASVLATPHAQRDVRLNATRAKHRANIEAALEGDSAETPLEAYARYVHWTIEHYPQGHSAESGILELLEEATRVLKDEGEGRNKADKRYLELWILYAGYVDKPALVYSFLLANEIGTAHARLYEEYAMMLERSGNKAKADEIYLLGLARRAEPLEHLQNRHRDFQKRMMTSRSMTASHSAASTTSASSSSTALSQPPSQRQVLGTARKTTASRRAASGTRNDDVFGAPRAPSSSSSGSIASRPNGRLAIFVDPEGDAEEDGAASGNAWPELETRRVRVKENVRASTKMAETTLKGRTKPAAKPVARFVPFRDPEPGEEELEDGKGRNGNGMPPPKSMKSFVPFRDVEEEEAGKTVPATPKFVPFRDEDAIASPSSATVPETVMKPKALKELSEAEALRKNPFKNYRDDERPVLNE